MFDFSGTGPEVKGNCNAPRAVTMSALIYCLRCMVGHDVPLNQVCSLHIHKPYTCCRYIRMYACTVCSQPHYIKTHDSDSRGRPYVMNK